MQIPERVCSRVSESPDQAHRQQAPTFTFSNFLLYKTDCQAKYDSSSMKASRADIQPRHLEDNC